MKIIIAGGSGFIGKHLYHTLNQQGHEVTILSRSPKNLPADINTKIWNGTTLTLSETPDVIINLCGENIASGRWTESKKRALINSRIKPTQAIVNYLKTIQTETKPRLMNASAIGYYPSHPEEQTEACHKKLNESSFSYQLIQRWESSALLAKDHGCDTCCLRIGVVLGAEGGILNNLKLLHQFKFGALMGEKSSFLSWIHIIDLCLAISFLLQVPSWEKAYNLVAPQPASQLEFSRAISQANSNIINFPVPSLLLKFAFGQLAEELMLANQRILPENLSKAGFKFKYNSISDSIDNIFK